MTIRLRGRVTRLAPGLWWAWADAWNDDTSPQLRTRHSANAASWAEALQVAYVMLRDLDEALMAEVHESRARRRTDPHTLEATA